MEIASPLAFHRSTTVGSKRQLSSPSQMVEENFDVSVSGSSILADGAKYDTSVNPSKRRRCFQPTDRCTNENSHNFSSASSSSSPFDRRPFPSSSTTNFFNGNLYGSTAKRSRNVASEHEHTATQSFIRSQTEEIAILRAEKNELQNTLRSVQAEKMKLSEENRILKRGVAIQVERHNQVFAHLGSIKQENTQLKDHNARLEQQVHSLRYQLQVQAHNQPINDFMGFPPRPPDVF